MFACLSFAAVILVDAISRMDNNRSDGLVDHQWLNRGLHQGQGSQFRLIMYFHPVMYMKQANRPRLTPYTLRLISYKVHYM